MSASARGSSCHAGDVSSLSPTTTNWSHHSVAPQRESPPSSSMPPLLSMASQIAPSTGMVPTLGPMPMPISFFEAPNPNAHALGHMTFSHVSASSSPSGSTSLHPHQNAAPKNNKESHDSKRIKVEGPNAHKAALSHHSSAVNSNRLGCAVPFDEDPSLLRSFEIDYSKVYGPTGQARFMTDMTPRLGNGFYVGVDKPATFAETNVRATIEEDFLDDNAFDQALSDDEDSPENMDQPQAHGPEAHYQEAQHLEEAHCRQTHQQESSHHQETHRQETRHQDAHHQDTSHLEAQHQKLHHQEASSHRPKAHHQEDNNIVPQHEMPPTTEQARMDRSQAEQKVATTTSSFSALPPSWDQSHLAMPPSTMGLSAGPMWSSLQHTFQQQGMQHSMQHGMHQNLHQSSAMPLPTAPTANTSGGMFVLTPEERRRLIEIALGPSGLPTFYPPSRFNFNMTNDYLSPPMQQANPISMRFGIGNDPTALRLLSADLNTSETASTPLSHTAAVAHPHPAPAATPGGYPGERDMRGSRHPPRHHHQPRVDTAGAGIHARTGPAPSRRMVAEPSAAKARSADRVAHNDVERKYRTNLRDKIAELRNAVPVLRQAYESERSPAAASSKVSKGTVLTKATEYIHHLEQRNRDILNEHQQLTHRLQAFETLLHSSLHAEMIPSHSMALFDPRGFC